MSDANKPEPVGVPMDERGGRNFVPAAVDRLRGADRSGLGAKGWAEVPKDGIGDPNDSNVPPAYYEPADSAAQSRKNA